MLTFHFFFKRSFRYENNDKNSRFQTYHFANIKLAVLLMIINNLPLLRIIKDVPYYWLLTIDNDN